MARTLLIATGAGVLIAWNWARLETPRPGVGDLALVVALAVAPALFRQRRLRAAAAVVAGIGAAWVALSVSPLDVRPFNGDDDYLGPLLGRIRTGFLDFYDVTVPFDGVAQPGMHGVLLLAVFAFTLLTALAVAARRPVAAALALLIGAGWPATILPGSDDLLRGAFLLAAVLALLAGLEFRPRRVPAQVLAGAAVLVLALSLATTSAVARGQFVDWQSWDVYNDPDEAVGVSYVWRANYDGVQFPNKRTRVLRVRATGRAGYWRATTLDAFRDDVWDEDLLPAVALPLSDGSNVEVLLPDGLVPEGAADEDKWSRADVRVEALADNHLVGPSMPVAYDTGGLRGDVQYHSGGVALVPGLLGRGDEFTVWGYAPRPKPADLARSRPDYPEEIVGVDGHYLSVDRGRSVPPFGTPGREEFVEALVADELSRYQDLYLRAQAIAGEARNPYVATVALEAWFRTGGGFEYDESPPARPVGVAPLVFFLTESKAGYCQHFAGAMALMLRYLGIPARVAAGFTSGAYDRDRRVWNVSDRNAHTWVEVWFKGWGWLPFDPTPGRGNLSGSYTASSFSFDAPGARDLLIGSGLTAANALLRFQLARGSDAPSDDVTPRDLQRAPEAGGGESGPGAAPIVLLVLLAVALLLVGAKVARTRRRYLTRDPRQLATACRQELVEFLADQRIDVPRSATLVELRTLVHEKTGVETRGLVQTLGTARFGPLGTAPAAARAARVELRAVRNRLRHALSRSERLRGTFSLRSLLVR